MRKPIRVALLSAAISLAAPGAGGADTPSREPIRLPEDVKAIFLAQMLGHIVALDGVVQALGEGAYARAGEIAAAEMGPPRLSDTGGTSGPGLGVAEHMPERFRAISKDFHAAAEAFAALARDMPDEPSGAQHRALTAALGEITKQCRICHDSYQVE